PDDTGTVTAGTSPITMTDLARFAPDDTTTIAEPDGVGVVRLPVNFIAPATEHTTTGTLFDQPVTVRFTPIEYEFIHGDGTTATRTTPGRTWADLALPQLTATDTSHAYTERGTYTAHTLVHYTADIDLGTGWTPVPGTLTIPTPDTTIHIYELHTALVEHTCDEDPTGPGC
ncbi:hypothetical protein, partial [Microbacterium sp.]|uniref:hypothetical protein n=1 Tax=Microbacterium sp. TaxID=51671 RepID=UPI003A8B2DE0